MPIVSRGLGLGGHGTVVSVVVRRDGGQHVRPLQPVHRRDVGRFIIMLNIYLDIQDR